MAILLLAIAASISMLYAFVYRPIERDKKLEECLYGAGVTLPDNVSYEDYEKRCLEKYGK